MNTSNRQYLISTSLAVLAIGLLLVSCQRPVTTVPGGNTPPPGDPNPAMNDPDQFNWGLFAQVNQPIPDTDQVKFTSKNTNVELTTNNVLWETWADDVCTFPDSPKLANPPTWDGCADVKTFQTSSQLSQARQGTGPTEALACDEKDITPENPNCEEVHRNRPAFDYIMQNKLWYQEGLAVAFAAGGEVKFPIEAIEVKANWIPLPPGADKNQYHWNHDQEGDVWVMIAMHIMSKAVPNWTWATWEWEGNPGRCDYLGCLDTFGVIPANVASNPQPTPQPYPAGELTAQLLSLFKQYGLGPEWQHYRLKGSQTNFVDATGRTTLLGNSVTENGFIQTSSCITCHSRAAVDSTGQSAIQGKALSVFEPTPPPAPSPDTARSYNGVPDPAWFFDLSQHPPQVTALQMDFVWATFNAKSLTPTPAPAP